MEEVTVRRVIASTYVTLDGVVEDPGGAEGFDRDGWAFEFDRGPEGDRSSRLTRRPALAHRETP
jgi:hypothetical protein